MSSKPITQTTSRPSTARLGYLGAIALFALGVLLGVQRSVLFGRVADRLDRKHRELAMLEALRAGTLTVPAAQDLWLRRYGRRPATPLADLLPSELSPGTAVTVRQVKAARAAPGWVCRRAEVSVRDAELSAVVDLGRCVETATPPWRVTGIRIESASQSPGIVHAVLVLQTIAPATAP